MWNGASNLNRHLLDLYLSYGARSCADRELRVSALDRHKNGCSTISIILVGADLSWRLHFAKIPSKLLRSSWRSIEKIQDLKQGCYTPNKRLTMLREKWGTKYSEEIFAEWSLQLKSAPTGLILTVWSSFLRRSRANALSSRSAQKQAPYDKYKSNWCRFKLGASFRKNSSRIFGALFFA